jgi:hypothetical protein
MQWYQYSCEERFVLFLKRQRKSIDDTEGGKQEKHRLGLALGVV